MTDRISGTNNISFLIEFSRQKFSVSLHDMSASTIDSSLEDANASINTLTIIIFRLECILNEDLCISRIIWKVNAMRNQLQRSNIECLFSNVIGRIFCKTDVMPH
jgi:hypothetical protein